MANAEISKYQFSPERTLGLFVHLPLLLLLVLLDFAGFLFFFRQKPGLLFFVLLIISLLLLIPIFFIGYRTLALIFSSYRMERDGFHIQWGLRKEIIPLTEIEWIRTPKEMPFEIPWSFLPMPGAYLGKVSTENYPLMEFIASDVLTMLFIGTSRCIYAISPAKPCLFLESFSRIFQLGSLSEIEWQTIRPVDWLSESWKNRTARFSVITSITLLSFLSLWIGFRFSSHQVIQLGYSAAGIPQESIPVENVLLIPIFGVLFCFFDLFIGMHFYQQDSTRQMADFFWIASVLVSFLLVLSGIAVL